MCASAKLWKRYNVVMSVHWFTSFWNFTESVPSITFQNNKSRFRFFQDHCSNRAIKMHSLLRAGSVEIKVAKVNAAVVDIDCWKNVLWRRSGVPLRVYMGPPQCISECRWAEIQSLTKSWEVSAQLYGTYSHGSLVSITFKTWAQTSIGSLIHSYKRYVSCVKSSSLLMTNICWSWP